MKNPVAHALFKLAVFLLPVAALFAYPAWALWSSGEFSRPKTVLRLQEAPGPETLVGFAHSEPWGYLKVQAVIRRKPEVITLGTSRVLPFRKDVFKVPFYNAGGGARAIGQFQRFVKKIPDESKPRWIVIGLDQNFFNPKWDRDPIDNFRKPAELEGLTILAERWYRVYEDRFQGKFTEGQILSPPNDIRRVGLTALVRDEGYHKDGSYRWNIPEETKFEQDLEWIRANQRFLVRGHTISTEAVARLKRFLDTAHRRGIRVAALLPPYAPTIYGRFSEKKEDYAHVFHLGEVLRPVFEKRGLPFADFTDPASVPASDDDFLDGQHLSPNAMRRLWRKFADSHPELAALTADAP